MSVFKNPHSLDPRMPYYYKIKWADGKETDGKLMLGADVARSFQLDLAIIKAVGDQIGHYVSPLAEDTLLEFVKMR